MEYIEQLIQREERITSVSYERESSQWVIAGVGWGFSCYTDQLEYAIQHLDEFI